MQLVVIVVSVNNMAAVATRRDPYTGDTKKSMREGKVYSVKSKNVQISVSFLLFCFNNPVYQSGNDCRSDVHVTSKQFRF